MCSSCRLNFRLNTAGEGLEPSVSAFNAQRVASYTIPQNLIGAAGLEPAILRLSVANIGYKPTALPLSYAPKFMLVAESGLAPASLNYRLSALLFELHRERSG